MVRPLLRHGFSKKTSSTYFPADTATWTIGRLASSTATHIAPNTPNISRTSSFTYHGLGATCLNGKIGYLCSETVQPDAATLGDNSLIHTTSYEYDTWGNRSKTTANFNASPTGGAVASRSSSVTFDGNGRFPIYAYNALSHQEMREFDTRFGVASVVTGPNGLSVKTTYDGFGRKVRETSFSGASGTGNIVSDAIWEAMSCAAASANGHGCEGQEVYAQRVTATGGAQSYVYFDNLQRELRKKTLNYAGWATARVTYDIYGRKLGGEGPVTIGDAPRLIPGASGHVLYLRNS